MASEGDDEDDDEASATGTAREDGVAGRMPPPQPALSDVYEKISARTVITWLRCNVRLAVIFEAAVVERSDHNFGTSRRHVRVKLAETTE